MSGLTLPLQVKVNATDNVAVASVSVSFDVRDRAQRSDHGKGTGPTYTAIFPALSGAEGDHATLNASAIDTSGNTATTSISVNVESPIPCRRGFALAPQRHTRRPGFHSNGEGFEFRVGLTVEWNGKGVATTFVNAGKVTATISKADIATAGSATVAVKNPAPGGGTSNTLTFTIR